MKQVLLIPFLCILFAGCSNKEKADDDRDAPLVSIHSPANDETFAVGSHISIAGNISDAGRIIQVHLHISSLETGQLLVDIHRYPGASTYQMQENFQVPSAGPFRIQVIARDNSNNEGRQTVVVHGN